MSKRTRRYLLSLLLLVMISVTNAATAQRKLTADQLDRHLSWDGPPMPLSI